MGLLHARGGVLKAPFRGPLKGTIRRGPGRTLERAPCGPQRGPLQGALSCITRGIDVTVSSIGFILLASINTHNQYTTIDGCKKPYG